MLVCYVLGQVECMPTGLCCASVFLLEDAFQRVFSKNCDAVLLARGRGAQIMRLIIYSGNERQLLCIYTCPLLPAIMFHEFRSLNKSVWIETNLCEVHQSLILQSFQNSFLLPTQNMQKLSRMNAEMLITCSGENQSAGLIVKLMSRLGATLCLN